MIERLAAAARGATDAYAAGDGLWMLEGGVRSDAFFRDIVRAVLTAAREASNQVLCVGGTTVMQGIDREGMFVAGIARDTWKSMIDTILAEPQ